MRLVPGLNEAPAPLPRDLRHVGIHPSTRGQWAAVAFDIRLGESAQSVDFDYDLYAATTRGRTASSNPLIFEPEVAGAKRLSHGPAGRTNDGDVFVRVPEDLNETVVNKRFAHEEEHRAQIEFGEITVAQDRLKRVRNVAQFVAKPALVGVGILVESAGLAMDNTPVLQVGVGLLVLSGIANATWLGIRQWIGPERRARAAEKDAPRIVTFVPRQAQTSAC